VQQATERPTWAKRLAAKWLGKKMAKHLAKSDPRRTHWSSIAAFVCGLFSLVFFLFFFFSIFASGAAVVFGFIGMERSGKDREHKNRGLALAGLIMGVAAALMLGLFMLAGWFF
jgi:MFS family permease